MLTAIKYTLFLAVGLGIIYHLFSTYYNANFLKDLKNLDVKWLTASVLCVAFANIFRALRWQLMITPLTNKKPNFLNVFNALMIGYLINLALPRAGELARCTWLAKKEEMDTANLIGSVIAERIFDLLILLLLVLLSSFLYYDLLISFVQFDNYQLPKTKFLIGVTLSILCLIGVLLFVSYAKFKQNAFVKKLYNIIEKLWAGITAVGKVENKFTFVLFTLLIWLLYIASSYLAFKMLAQTELLTFADALLTVVAGSFGMVAPIQGGLGAFHFMVSKCLILLGVTSTPALVYATVLHASQTILVVILGATALVLGINLNLKKTV